MLPFIHISLTLSSSTSEATTLTSASRDKSMSEATKLASSSRDSSMLLIRSHVPLRSKLILSFFGLSLVSLLSSDRDLLHPLTRLSDLSRRQTEVIVPLPPTLLNDERSHESARAPVLSALSTNSFLILSDTSNAVDSLSFCSPNRPTKNPVTSGSELSH